MQLFIQHRHKHLGPAQYNSRPSANLSRLPKHSGAQVFLSKNVFLVFFEAVEGGFLFTSAVQIFSVFSLEAKLSKKIKNTSANTDVTAKDITSVTVTFIFGPCEHVPAVVPVLTL